MIRTQVYIPEDLHQQALLLARKNNENFSIIVRKGLKTVIDNEMHKTKGDWTKFVGACKSTGKSNAVSDIHNYYKNQVI